MTSKEKNKSHVTVSFCSFHVHVQRPHLCVRVCVNARERTCTRERKCTRERTCTRTRCFTALNQVNLNQIKRAQYAHVSVRASVCARVREPMHCASAQVHTLMPLSCSYLRRSASSSLSSLCSQSSSAPSTSLMSLPDLSDEDSALFLRFCRTSSPASSPSLKRSTSSWKCLPCPLRRRPILQGTQMHSDARAHMHACMHARTHARTHACTHAHHTHVRASTDVDDGMAWGPSHGPTHAHVQVRTASALVYGEPRPSARARARNTQSRSPARSRTGPVRRQSAASCACGQGPPAAPSLPDAARTGRFKNGAERCRVHTPTASPPRAAAGTLLESCVRSCVHASGARTASTVPLRACARICAADDMGEERNADRSARTHDELFVGPHSERQQPEQREGRESVLGVGVCMGPSWVGSGGEFGGSGVAAPPRSIPRRGA